MTAEPQWAGDVRIAYEPSFLARTARFLLPQLESVLPRGAYQRFYDAAYDAYQRALRRAYLLKVVRSGLLGDEHERAKVSLTYRLLPYSMAGRLALENAFDLTALVEQRRVPGALVECGVARGGTAAMMALTSRRFGATARGKWFFDSFEGMPDPGPCDFEGGRVGEVIRPLVKGSCLGTIEHVRTLMFDTLGLSEEEVHLVKGWFKDTVPEHRDRIGAIAVLRLDGDWYESTRIPLDHLYDSVSPGGFVIVDDYATCFGSRRATDEFRRERNIAAPLQPDGRGGAWFQKGS